MVRTKKLFPEANLTLVVDNLKVKLKNDLGQLVNIHLYIRDKRIIDRLFSKSKLDTDFRKGFWQFSIERFFALSDYHKTIPNQPLLHFESDLIIFPNFPFSEISSQKSLIWCKYNQSRDVGSLHFSPNFQESDWLCGEIFEGIYNNPLHTDMTILQEIRKVNSYRIKTFPILESTTNTLFNIQQPFTFEQISFGDIQLKTGGIFDSAPIGMWLLGQDPRNHYGIKFLHDTKIFISDKCYINPSLGNYVIDKSGSIYLKNGDISIPIFCLHVHSKEIRLFNEKSITNLSRYIALGSVKNLQKRFIFSSLINETIMQIKKQNAIKYLAYSPPFRRITTASKRIFS